MPIVDLGVVAGGTHSVCTKTSSNRRRLGGCVGLRRWEYELQETWKICSGRPRAEVGLGPNVAYMHVSIETGLSFQSSPPPTHTHTFLPTTLAWPAAGRLQDMLEQLGSALVGGNAERNFHRWAARQMWHKFLPEPFDFTVRLADHACELKAGKTMIHSCLLPHESFSCLWMNARPVFDELFGSAEELRKWWDGAADLDDEWYRNHPVIRSSLPEHRVPIGLHGDDAGVHGQEQVLVITWNALTKKMPTIDNRIVFTMLRCRDILGSTTMNVIYNVLRWSLEALAIGRHPSCDHNGKMFGQSYEPKRFMLAGTPLAPVSGNNFMRAAFGEIRGDWKWLKEAFYFHAHYGKPDFICHRCEASKIAGSSSHSWRYTDFRRCAAHRGSCYSHADWMRMYQRAAIVSPLIFIVGFHMTRIVFDMMHCVDLGWLQVLVPSLLKNLVEIKWFAGENTEARYSTAFRKYKVWAKRNKIKSLVKKRFSHKSWGTGDKGWPRVSQLQAKAAAMRSLLYFFEEELEGPNAAKTDLDALRYLMVHHLCEADRCCRRAGRHFSKREHNDFSRHLERALVSYNALAAWALTNNKKLYKTLPKMHAITHYFDGRINPRRCQCYADEDMVGRMKRIYSLCHGATAPKRALERYHAVVCIRWWKKLQSMQGLLK